MKYLLILLLMCSMSVFGQIINRGYGLKITGDNNYFTITSSGDYISMSSDSTITIHGDTLKTIRKVFDLVIEKRKIIDSLKQRIIELTNDVYHYFHYYEDYGKQRAESEAAKNVIYIFSETNYLQLPTNKRFLKAVRDWHYFRSLNQ